MTFKRHLQPFRTIIRTDSKKRRLPTSPMKLTTQSHYQLHFFFTEPYQHPRVPSFKIYTKYMTVRCRGLFFYIKNIKKNKNLKILDFSAKLYQES